MEHYEWITMDIWDYNSDDDMLSMNEALQNDYKDEYSDMLDDSYFPYIVRRQIEEKGNNYKRYSKPIGVLFLVIIDKVNNILLVETNFIDGENTLLNINECLNILRKKLNGETNTEYLWKKEYEGLMKNFTIISKSDSSINNSLYGDYIGNYLNNNYYILSYEQGMTLLEKENIKCKCKAFSLNK